MCRSSQPSLNRKETHTSPRYVVHRESVLAFAHRELLFARCVPPTCLFLAVIQAIVLRDYIYFLCVLVASMQAKKPTDKKARKAVLEQQERRLHWGGFDDKAPPDKVRCWHRDCVDMHWSTQRFDDKAPPEKISQVLVPYHTGQVPYHDVPGEDRAIRGL